MRKLLRWEIAGVVAALALVSFGVLRVSSAAFTGTTSNSGNSWAAGTVSLSDSENGTAMFSATNWKPTSQESQCIEVTYGGSITPSAAVALYASVTDTTVGGNGLSDDLDVVVAMGAAGSSCTLIGVTTQVYNGTLAAFPGSSSGASTWTPVLGVDTMRPFQFTVTLGADTANDAQGESATAAFTWSATS